MDKNNHFTFSLKKFMIRYGIIFGVIELVLICIGTYIFPPIGLLVIVMFFIFMVYLVNIVKTI